MEFRNDWPRIGRIDVPPETLREPGTTLADLLAELGFREPRHDGAGLPASGWRVLARSGSSVALGAPVDESHDAWRIVQVRSDDPASGCSQLHVHPDPEPRRPSRAECARGLALRWPASARGASDLDVLAIDILNTGSERWTPDGDSFHVVGSITRQGQKHGGFLFGFVQGANPSFVLDPGEYARTRVTIPPDQWRDLHPGAHEIHAVLAALPVTPTDPLAVELTQEMIDRHRPRRSAPPRPEHDQHAMMRARLEILQAMIAAGARVPELVGEIVDADDDASVRRVAELLACSPEAARAVLEMPLRRLRAADLQRVADEAVSLARELDEPVGGDRET
jgi:hypothetical protein